MSSKPQIPNDPFQFSADGLSFDPASFDLFIRDQGIEMTHFSAMACPMGLIDRDDIHKPHEDHAGCSNGFIYLKVGNVICSWQSNNKTVRMSESGRDDGSQVQCTFPRFYEKCTLNELDRPIYLSPFDRFYMSDEKIQVVTWERFNASITGHDKLRFPVLGVLNLIDSTGKTYVCGVDFDYSGGIINWVPGHGPKWDPTIQKGTVCSVKYLYRPYWYVARMVHEVRVAQVPDMYGKRDTVRFPQACVLAREYVFENEKNDPRVMANIRQNPAPIDRDYVPDGKLGIK